MSLPMLRHAGATARPATVSSKRSVTCKASTARPQRLPGQGTDTSRREVLQASLLASWIVAGPAAAVCADLNTAEAGDACRAAELLKDTAAEQKAAGNYKSLSTGATKKLAPNVPVGDLDAEYSRATRDLAAKIDKYLTTDVYDKTRQPLIKSLKTDGYVWVSKYARGGSARSQSARNMYIAVDAVQGYLASNGLAPFPASKAKVVAATLNKSLAFLDEGR